MTPRIIGLHRHRVHEIPPTGFEAAFKNSRLDPHVAAHTCITRMRQRTHKGLLASGESPLHFIKLPSAP